MAAGQSAIWTCGLAPLHLQLSHSSWKPAERFYGACSARDLPVGTPAGERLPPPSPGPHELTDLPGHPSTPDPGQHSPSVSNGLGQRCNRLQDTEHRVFMGRWDRSPPPPDQRDPLSGVFPGREPWPGAGRGDTGRLYCIQGPLGLSAGQVTREASSLAWESSVSTQPVPRKQGLGQWEPGGEGQFWAPL